MAVATLRSIFVGSEQNYKLKRKNDISRRIAKTIYNRAENVSFAGSGIRPRPTISEIVPNSIESRSHWQCTKHVAAWKLYENKLVILNFFISMSPRLPS